MGKHLESFPGYTLIRPLADGGMTHLFIAWNAQRRRVVLRTLQPRHMRNRRMVRSFLAGGHVLSQLEHRHIVRLLDRVHAEAPLPYMALEYHEGSNMRELILQRSPQLRPHALPAMRQLADALLYLHRMGYAHMDLKPENLLLRPDGKLILIDFDLCVRLKTWNPLQWRPPGTPAYIAPEVFRLRPVNEQADIYSFGITCYEMLRLHKPSEDLHLQDVLNGHPYPASDTAARECQTLITPRLGAILRKCLARETRARYPSMSLVLKDLNALRL